MRSNGLGTTQSISNKRPQVVTPKIESPPPPTKSNSYLMICIALGLGLGVVLGLGLGFGLGGSTTYDETLADAK